MTPTPEQIAAEEETARRCWNAKNAGEIMEIIATARLEGANASFVARLDAILADPEAMERVYRAVLLVGVIEALKQEAGR